MNVQEYIYIECLKVGMTKEGACALLANIQAESAFRSNNVEDRSGIPDEVYTANVDNRSYSKEQFIRDELGYGIAQWTYFQRKEWMYDFLIGSGLSIGDLAGQVKFLFWEMQNHFNKQWKLITTSNDLYTCTWELLDKWENPAEKKNNMNVRYQNACNWYSKFSNSNLSDYFIDDQITSDASEESIQNGIGEETTVISWPPRTIDDNCFGWPEVRLCQALLRCRGYNILDNGIYTDSMKEKVMQFQVKNGLVGDGCCGPDTWKKLLALPANF